MLRDTTYRVGEPQIVPWRYKPSDIEQCVRAEVPNHRDASRYQDLRQVQVGPD